MKSGIHFTTNILPIISDTFISVIGKLQNRKDYRTRLKITKIHEEWNTFYHEYLANNK